MPSIRTAARRFFSGGKKDRPVQFQDDLLRTEADDIGRHAAAFIETLWPNRQSPPTCSQRDEKGIDPAWGTAFAERGKRRLRLLRGRLPSAGIDCAEQARTVLNALYYSAFICHSGRLSTYSQQVGITLKA
ncbi:hypothetical protein GGE45_003723 [Rhizobium aethiopicum]|uniref:Uncharacterized protein n=1 Tax=Rhizobium aethiopicum TaxID=1138170 RepID=A0A7W6QAQ9_9HYPH|nr:MULTISPECIES: hypothetical protein [Rhizobium]MBB4194105.1 hypothetical protein [Rhizobium aethiopicum]MBB4581375.1 hypothetical protein [Rhizobium aethiopicum]MDO3432474.1 hypothetical protein [Rhizobium sp. CBN3]